MARFTLRNLSAATSFGFEVRVPVLPALTITQWPPSVSDTPDRNAAPSDGKPLAAA